MSFFFLMIALRKKNKTQNIGICVCKIYFLSHIISWKRLFWHQRVDASKRILAQRLGNLNPFFCVYSFSSLGVFNMLWAPSFTKVSFSVHNPYAGNTLFQEKGATSLRTVTGFEAVSRTIAVPNLRYVVWFYTIEGTKL